ncbi:MAG TPA: hypothetical protein VHY91_23790 [Pirellulales bacterium]|jgi:hypothetical protein|nr:hypothetical protein [Pirellulales bacterium]
MILFERVKSWISLPSVAAAAVLGLVALSTWSLGGAQPPADSKAQPASQTEAASLAAGPNAKPEEPIEPRKPGAVIAPPRTAPAVQATEGERALPEFSAARSGQIDVTHLGIAIIDAEGELELAKNELTYVESLYRDKVTNINEVKTAQIKTQTARRKLNFLTRVAQMAHESARQELGFQTKAFQRVSELRAQNALSALQVEQAQRQLSAAKDKVSLLETIPGVKPPGAADAPAKTG